MELRRLAQILLGMTIIISSVYLTYWSSQMYDSFPTGAERTLDQKLRYYRFLIPQILTLLPTVIAGICILSGRLVQFGIVFILPFILMKLINSINMPVWMILSNVLEITLSITLIALHWTTFKPIFALLFRIRPDLCSFSPHETKDTP